MCMKINYCLVNWAYEDEELLLAYEWQEEDPMEWLFQVELLFVSSKMMQDCLMDEIGKISLDDGYYIISDGKYSLAIAINDGYLCMRSFLEYELAKDVKERIKCLNRLDITYQSKGSRQIKELGLTRFEKEKKQLLLAYLDIFDHEEVSELASHNWDYIEQGYHLLHEYLYLQISKQKLKDA